MKRKEKLEINPGWLSLFERRWPIVMRFRNFCWRVAHWRRWASPSRAIDRYLPLPLRFVSLRRCSARRRPFSSPEAVSSRDSRASQEIADESRLWPRGTKMHARYNFFSTYACFDTLFITLITIYIWPPRRLDFQSNYTDIRWIFLEIH